MDIVVNIIWYEFTVQLGMKLVGFIYGIFKSWRLYNGTDKVT